MKHLVAGLAMCSFVTVPAIGDERSDQVVPQVASQVPLEPVAAEKIRYIDPTTGQITEQYWGALAEPVKRSLLPNSEAFIQIQQEDSKGGFSILPLSASVKKGSYKMLFRWQQYRADYCNSANPDAGRIRTGVALEIVAEIRTLKNGLNITNLGALTAAAEREKVSGSILIRQIGLGNSSPTLGTYMSNFTLNREGVTKALEAIAVTKAVLENKDNKLTPHYLSITETAPGACSSAAPPAALQAVTPG